MTTPGILTSIFDPAALEGWLREVYDLPNPTRCTLVSRSLNDTYRVALDNHTVAYLRIGRAGARTRAEVERELALVRTLAQAGVAVALPLARRDGSDVGEVPAPEGPRPVVLIAEAPGESVREITPQQSAAYGRLAAQVHNAADQVAPHHLRALDQDELIQRPLVAIRERMIQLHADPEEIAFLEAIAARTSARLAAIPRHAPDWGLCHGDLHPGNVRFAGTTPTLFDFDCCGFGWRAYDLAVFQWNAWMERREPAWINARWEAFLAGYRAVRELSDQQLAAVPCFLVARQIWLMGMDATLQSGYPPQWVGPDWLPSMNAVIRTWLEHFPSLH